MELDTGRHRSGQGRLINCGINRALTFVEGMLAKLFPLIENAGFGSSPKSSEPDTAAYPESSEDSPQPEVTKAKSRARTLAKKPPAGHSCAERIQSLKAEGFFAEKRSTAEIVSKLAEKRQTHNVSQVSAAAGNLVQRSLLQRIKDGNSWLYYWDRD